jgi:hypothetical protein
MQNNTQGFTFIELTLYGLLLAIFLTAVSQIFLSALDVSMESETYVANELDSRYIFSRLTYDIYRASSVVVPSSVGAVAHTISLAVGGNSYIYASTSGNLTLTTPSGTNVLNSIDTSLDQFDVTRIGTGSDSASLHILVTLKAKTIPHTGVQYKTYETTIGLRP